MRLSYIYRLRIRIIRFCPLQAAIDLRCRARTMNAGNNADML